MHDVLVQHPQAAARGPLSNRPGLIRAVDSVKRVLSISVEIEGSAPRGFLGPPAIRTGSNGLRLRMLAVGCQAGQAAFLPTLACPSQRAPSRPTAQPNRTAFPPSRVKWSQWSRVWTTIVPGASSVG